MRKIKMLVLDVDGVLTDCRLWLDSNGQWKRFFCIRDGVGIKRLIEKGYRVAIITGSQSEDIRARVKSLGIHHLYEGHLEKTPAFEMLKRETGFSNDEIAYVGDDIFDIPLIEVVAFGATVPEALDEVKAKAHYITQRPGGLGAVREVSDYIYQYGAFAHKRTE